MMLENTKVDAGGSRNQDAEREKSVLTIAQTAKFLQVSLPTLYRWKKNGVLEPIKICGRVYHKKQEIEDLFNRERRIK